MTKYKEGDRVSFTIEDELVTGTIEIVDEFGNFFDNSEPSYDVLVDNFRGGKCLIKHISESSLKTTTPFDEIKTALKEAIKSTSVNHCAGCEYEFDGNTIECVECHKNLLAEQEIDK